MISPIVRRVPPVDIPIQETSEQIIKALQKKFADQGYLRGLVTATVDQCAEQELVVNQEILLTYIKDNWDVFFPGVEENEINLAQARNSTRERLQMMKADICAKMMQYLTDADGQGGARPRYQSLLIPQAELNAMLRKPCNDGAHQFDYYPAQPPHQNVSGTVRSRWRRQIRSSWYICCGRGMFERVTIELLPCKVCHTTYRQYFSYRIAYCDQCDRSFHLSDTSFVQFLALVLSLGIRPLVSEQEVADVLEASGMHKDQETGLITKRQ